MRQVLREYVFRVWSYTFLNECCSAFEKKSLFRQVFTNSTNYSYFLTNCWRKVWIHWHYWNEKRMDYITWWCKNCLCGVWLVEVVKTWRRINEMHPSIFDLFYLCMSQLSWMDFKKIGIWSDMIMVLALAFFTYINVNL